MRLVGRLFLFVIATATVVAPRPSSGQAPRPGSGQASPPIPAGAERAYKALKDRVDGNAAMEVVRFMDPFWRISGNPGFNASVDHIRDGLQAAGVANRIEELAPRGRGWDYQAGTVSFADTGEELLSRERDRVSLCINSF